MGHSTASGRTVATPTAGTMTPQAFNDEVRASRGRALTSRDIDRLAGMLDRDAGIGDIVEAREPNRWHDITHTFTKTEGGWQSVRRNNDTGEEYENESVSSRDVSSRVLSTANVDVLGADSTPWQFRRKR